jgi:hypothetical protein
MPNNVDDSMPDNVESDREAVKTFFHRFDLKVE